MSTIESMLQQWDDLQAADPQILPMLQEKVFPMLGMDESLVRQGLDP